MEQYFTRSQSRSHFFRQVKGRWQTAHGLVGRCRLGMAGDCCPARTIAFMPVPDADLPSDRPFADLTLRTFLARTAAKEPTPGGGSVAGVAGGLAAALGRMVVAYSLGKKNLEPHQGLLESAGAALDRAAAMMLRLADEDAAAYAGLNELSKLPKDDPRRRREWDAAVRAGLEPPVAIAGCGLEILRVLKDLCGTSNPFLRSDLAAAAVLAEAAVRAALWNVEVNLPSLGEEAQRESLRERSAVYAADAKRRAAEIEAACR